MTNGMVTVDDISTVIMIAGSTKMPIVRQFISKLFAGRISDGGNPDEIVCQGTGILCGIRERKSEIKDIVLSDICPFTLGIEVVDDIMSPIISKNQVLPCSHVKSFTTVNDNQKVIHWHVYQGENHKASLNLSLAEFEMKIPPKPKGAVSVEVRFSYDINGLFDIDIYCPATGEHIHRELGATDGMSPEEIAAGRAALEKMKIHPRNIEKNKCILERAEALYIECNEEQQAFLAQAIKRFQAALDKQQITVAERAYRMLQVQLSMVEASMFRFDVFDRQKWNETFADEEDCEEDYDEKTEV